MKTELRTLLVGLALLSTLNPQLSTVLAQGTTFTYQGRLTEGPDTATGLYDLSFSLFAASGGGAPLSGPLTTNGLAVSNGLFTVTLDFGADFPGAERFLEIGARTNGGGAFTTLTPRQKLTATPYAVTARNITGVVPSASLSGTYSSAVTLNNAGNSFTGSGAGLTGVNAATLGGLNANQFWRTAGNSGATAANFVGTTDNQPLELRVNGQRAFRLQPNSGAAPTIIGGSNTVGATLVSGAVIAGGEMNLIENFGTRSTVSGGFSNQILGAQYATIAGGNNNLIQAGCFYSTIGGGKDNFLDFSAQQVVIAGGDGNRMEREANSSAIGGGWQNVIQSNTAVAVIAGGFTNSIGPFVSGSTIGGGWLNSIQRRADYSVIGGGRSNRIQPTNETATIAGGLFNEIQTGSLDSTISGGSSHTIASNSQRAFIGGGDDHTIASSLGVIVGGGGHVIETNALNSFIGGGSGNRIAAGANHATIAGGLQNTNAGEYATIPGGRENVASGFASFAAGYGAHALHPGSFVWSSGGSFASTDQNQFLIRAAGGVGIGTGNPQYPLDVAGAVRISPPQFNGAEVLNLNTERSWAFRQLRSGIGTALELASIGGGGNKDFIINTTGLVGIGTTTPEATLHVNGGAAKPGGGSWSMTSDARLKKNIRPLAGALDKLLALHGVNFEYIDPAKINELSGERMGLVAQEVEKVFPDWVETGPDGYKRVTVRGLEALVVEALRELQQQQDAKLADELKRRHAENAELKRSVEELKALVEALARKSEGGVR